MEFQEATEQDLPEVINLLADDVLGKKRESPSPDNLVQYEKAFLEISKSSSNKLMVVKDDHKVIGTMQLTLIPSLTFKGGKRLQIEAVRIAWSHRGKGLGKKMITWALSYARDHGCHLIQLTSNKERDEALTFYKSCGFVATHEGFKYYLKD